MRSPKIARAVEELGRVQLSCSFFMRDFLYSEISNVHGIANLPEDPDLVEATAWGAAYVAGIARGVYPEPSAIAVEWRPEHRFEPQMTATERERRYAGWQGAVAGVLAAA